MALGKSKAKKVKTKSAVSLFGKVTVNDLVASKSGTALFLY